MSNQISLATGDPVSWTRIRKKSTGYNFSTQYGRLVDIDGDIGKVNMRGRVLSIPMDRLRHAKQRTALTEAFLAAKEATS